MEPDYEIIHITDIVNHSPDRTNIRAYIVPSDYSINQVISDYKELAEDYNYAYFSVYYLPEYKKQLTRAKRRIEEINKEILSIEQTIDVDNEYFLKNDISVLEDERNLLYDDINEYIDMIENPQIPEKYTTTVSYNQELADDWEIEHN